MNLNLQIYKIRIHKEDPGDIRIELLQMCKQMSAYIKAEIFLEAFEQFQKSAYRYTAQLKIYKLYVLYVLFLRHISEKFKPVYKLQQLNLKYSYDNFEYEKYISSIAGMDFSFFQRNNNQRYFLQMYSTIKRIDEKHLIIFEEFCRTKINDKRIDNR